MNENDQPTGPTPAAPAPAPPARRPGLRTVVTSRPAGWVAAAILAGTVAGLSVVLATGQPEGPVAVAGPVRFQVLPGGKQLSAGPGGPFRSIIIRPGARRIIMPIAPRWVADPGAVFGGIAALPPGDFAGQLMSPFGQVVAGTVGSVSGSTFTVTGSGGQPVTVREQPSTVYRQTGNPASASAVTRGARVAVLGTLSGTTMTATAVAVLAG